MITLTSSIHRNWRDLADLLDPVGCCADSLVEERPLDWYGIYTLAAAHLIAPALYSALSTTNRLHIAPADVRKALGELYRLNEARNNRQRKILRDIVRILNAQGIEPLLMKGSIALLPDQPSHAADRVMSDLDIALHNAAPERGEEALLVAGYRHATDQGPPGYQGHHHLAPLFHPNGEGYVEIHREVLEDKVPAGALALAAVCAAAEPVNWDGLRLWIPSIEHRLLHNALHHQVQGAVSYADRCSLRQLMEFVRLRASPAAAGIDWKDQLRRLDAFGVGDPVRVYLLLAARVFAQPLPAGVDLSKANRRAESRVWSRLGHPRLYLGVILASRLRYLPQRLITPSWYPEKYRRLHRRWAEWRDRRSSRH